MLCHWVEPLPGHLTPVPFFSVRSQSIENRKCLHYPCAKEFALQRLALAGIWPGKTLGEIIAESISVSSKELCGPVCTVWADGTHLTDLKVAALGFVKLFFLHSPPVSAGQRKSFWARWFRTKESSMSRKQLCEAGKSKKETSSILNNSKTIAEVRMARAVKSF